MNKDKLIEWLRNKKVVLRRPGGCSVLHESINSEKVNLINEIISFVQSEPEETCITLPCKIGETVWIISDKEAIECTLQDELIYKAKNYNLQIGRSIDGKMNGHQMVFKSKEDAEQSLEKAGE